VSDRQTQERRSPHRRNPEERKRAIARAVANVIDKTCASAVDAALGQGVSVAAVRRAVAEARRKA
jgi:hypothetical protein